jgi:hypothetical protein
MIVKDHRGKYYRVYEVTSAGSEPDNAMRHMWHGCELKPTNRFNSSKVRWFEDRLTRTGKQRWDYVLKSKATVVEADQ